MKKYKIVTTYMIGDVFTAEVFSGCKREVLNKVIGLMSIGAEILSYKDLSIPIIQNAMSHR